MFDTTMIGSRIKQARIDKNMTQMNLADAMGVSYQAVSNWERGNSMPDISKLGDLCAALDISVNALLGLEEAAPNPVVKAMNQEELTGEELAEVAPVLPPKTLQEQIDGKREYFETAKNRIREEVERVGELTRRVVGDALSNIQEITSNGEATGKIVKVTVQRKDRKKDKKLDLSRIADMAPFLDREYLDQLVRSADMSDLDGIEEIAPFLSRETLDYLVEQADVDELDEVVAIAPFLNRETIDKLVNRCAANDDFSTIEELAPFLSEESLDRLAENTKPDSIWEVAGFAPFFSRKTLDKLVLRCEDAEEYDAIVELAPFLSKETLDQLVDRYLEQDREADLEDLYPFMGKETLRKLAKRRMEQQDLDALEDMMPFL